MTSTGKNLGLSLRLRRPGDKEGGLMVRGYLEQGAILGSVVRRLGRKVLHTQPSNPALPHPPHTHTCTDVHLQEQTVGLLQRCLLFKKPGAAADFESL